MIIIPPPSQEALLQKIYDLEKKAHYQRDKDALYNLEGYCQSYLEEYPEDWNMLLKLALVVNDIPIVDNDKSIWILRHILQYCPTNLRALLLLAYIEDYSRIISDETLQLLSNFKTESMHEKAIISYMIACYYRFQSNILYFQYLQQACTYSSLLSKAHYFLALEYDEQQEYQLALYHIEIALAGIKKVYHYSWNNAGLPFDPDEYIGEMVEGMDITCHLLLCGLLRPML